MNVDLGFDETGYSILASFGFTLLYSVLSLVAGSTVDRVSRKAATVVSCFAWSAATAAQGLAGSFTDVLMVRVAQGSAQAFTTPAAYTLLSDLFPEEARATANSLYSSGVYFGGALASLCVLLDTQVGWRDSSFAVGGAGIVVALLAALLVPEPPRGALKMAAIQEESSSTIEKRKNEVEEADSFWESAKLVLSSETARLVYASTAVRFSAGFGIGLWSAPYFRAAFPDFAVQYSVTNAFVVASGGFLSSLLGGYLSDRFTPVDVRARAWVPMAGSMLAAPMWAAVMLSGSFYGAMGCLFVEYLVAECWFGPTVAILQGAVPASVRGTAQGGFAMLAAAGNVAPVIIGALQSSYPLHDVLLWMIPSLYLASAGLFYLTGESVKRDEDTRLQILEKEK
jgi:sugar phosphate permease